MGAFAVPWMPERMPWSSAQSDAASTGRPDIVTARGAAPTRILATTSPAATTPKILKFPNRRIIQFLPSRSPNISDRNSLFRLHQKIQYVAAGLGHGRLLQRHRVAEILEPTHRPLHDGLAVEAVEVVAAHVLVDRPLLEHVVDGDQDGVSYGDDGPSAPPPGLHSVVVGSEVGVLDPDGRLGGFDQRAAQRLVPVPDRAGASLSPRLVVAGAKLRPGGERLVIGPMAHVGADLGQDRLGGDRTDSGDRLQRRHGRLKRAHSGLYLGADLLDPGLQEVDVPEQALDHRALVLVDRPFQGQPQRGPLLLQLALGQLGHLVTVGDPGSEGLEHVPPTLAHDVGGNVPKLDVPPLQHLLQSAHLVGSHLHQAPPIADRLLQLALGPLGDPARAEQPVPKQIGDPLGILDVRLAAWHRLHVAGVDHHQLDALTFQEVVHRLPVDPGALHRQARDPLLLEPVQELQQLPGDGPERSYLLPLGGEHAGHHVGLMDIQAAAPLMDHSHRTTSKSFLVGGRTASNRFSSSCSRHAGQQSRVPPVHRPRLVSISRASKNSSGHSPTTPIFDLSGAAVAAWLISASSCPSWLRASVVPNPGTPAAPWVQIRWPGSSWTSWTSRPSGCRSS